MRLGNYELERELGRGGMGAAWLARHLPTDAERVVKLLQGAADPVALARFRREAEALARVGGDGVVPIHEVGHEGGRAFIAMAYLRGGSLRARLEREGRLPWNEAALAVLRVARALARCHAAGLVHRDVKPENVFLDEAGLAWLGDFGLVRDLDASRLTETGAVAGTLPYVAPEVLAGEPAGAPADVWALGVVLHELVTGERPFPDGSPLARIASMRARSWRRLSRAIAPPWMNAVLARALEPDPRARLGALDLARELEDALAGRVVTSSPWRAVILAAVILAISGGAIARGLLPSRPRDDAIAPVPSRATVVDPGMPPARRSRSPRSRARRTWSPRSPRASGSTRPRPR